MDEVSTTPEVRQIAAAIYILLSFIIICIAFKFIHYKEYKKVKDIEDYDTVSDMYTVGIISLNTFCSWVKNKEKKEYQKLEKDAIQRLKDKGVI